MFSPKTYIQRREVLRNSLDSGIILFLGNDESSMNYAANPYLFRQDSSFLYYFGIDSPGLAGIIDIDEGVDIVFGDDLSMDMIVWMGRQAGIRERASDFGIDKCEPYSMLDRFVRKAIRQSRAVHFLPPYRPENRIKLLNLIDIHPDDLLDNASKFLIKAVVSQREIKSDEEVLEIEKAVDLSADMHLEAMRMVRPGMMESEVAAKVTQVALAANTRPAFPVIATINGQILHNHYHGNMIQSGDLFLLDAGAESSMHYAADLSSTFPVDEAFTGLQKEIYNISLKAHEAAIELLGPGTLFREVHLTACKEIFEGLKELKLTRGDTEEAVHLGAHALFFPCGTGHMMGLDVHDMEDMGEQHVGYGVMHKSEIFGLKSLRLAKNLKPGFVLTIEPGIYFIPELLGMWKSEKRFENFLNYSEIEKLVSFGGLRKEEDFLITEDGARRLGKYVPKKIEEIEAVRQL